VQTELLDRWRSVPTAVTADVSQGVALVDPAIRPLRPAGQQPKLFGRAVTARCSPPDFGAVLRALDLVTRGNVLVIDAKGNRDHAMIGGILGGFLRKKGAAGIVCDGAVRDVAELGAWDDLSTFARSITPRGPTAWSAGEVQVPVQIGGRTVHPGDLVMGDDDGLVVLSNDMQASLIASAEKKLALEEQWMADIASGKSIAQTFGLR
jgi:RraA family protein